MSNNGNALLGAAAGAGGALTFGTAGAAGTALTGLGVANIWNPIGWGLLGASALAGGFKIARGITDKRKANRLDEKYNLGNRPEAEIPEGFNKYMSQQERLAASDLPGRNIIEGDIRQSTAQSLSGVRQLASTESSAMSGLLGTLGQERSAMRQLGTQALQWQAQQQQNLGQAYQQQGQMQQGLFDQNEMMPWQIGMNQAEAFRNTGNQNVYGGIDQIGAAATTGLSMYNTNQQYDKMIDWWSKNNQGGGSQGNNYSPQNGLGFGYQLSNVNVNTVGINPSSWRK